MKRLIVALVAGTFALSSIYAVAAEPMDAPQGQSRTENAKDYVKDKTRKAKKKTKRAAKRTKAKVKSAVDNRTTTDPSSPNESKPDAKK
jgi:Ni/Co efflux regulator RcnB